MPYEWILQHNRFNQFSLPSPSKDSAVLLCFVPFIPAIVEDPKT